MIDCSDVYEELANASAEFTLAAGGACRASGVFDDDYAEIKLGSLGAESSDPTFTCASAPLSDPSGTLRVKERDTVLLKRLRSLPAQALAVAWLILDVKPDNEGSVTFTLQKA